MEKDDYTASGYSHPQYAKSFMDYGIPCELPRSKGWILKRKIPETKSFDAMGCYPLFTCQNWAELCTDLDEIGEELVAVSIVTDPFGDYDVEYLHKCFEDIVIEFKQHYVIDLHESMNSFVSSHHRRYARKSLRNLSVDRCDDPSQVLEEWNCLYDTLIRRHNITGMLRFSRKVFSKHLTIPGIEVFRASYEGSTLGILIWYVQGEVVHYHLGASSQDGYKQHVSFGLFWTAIEYFKACGLRWINLGSGAGLKRNDKDGLSSFKKGWSTETRTAYFCGRIQNKNEYREIMKLFDVPPTDYFPAYRQGEF